MKNFYSKLAATGIKNNRKLYIPYILAGSGMTAIVYIISFLQSSETLHSMGGGRTLTQVLGFGMFVMVLFSGIFLFYTNSFLIRRRKREFGLYNVLGMGKRSINKIMLRESLMIYLLTQLLGLFSGVALSKLAELGLIRIVHSTVTYTVVISEDSLVFTLISFAVIHLLIYLNSLRQLSFSSPLELMKSESVGEKSPKANPLMALVGIALMAGAYYIAITIDDPFDAMLYFFLAVIMVIVATYLLFITGSVTLCKALQKSKRFYYKPSHFISVSSMSYRMKRNGAGLASICILASMVLVTVSSTTSLYLGIEDQIANEYNHDVEVSVSIFTDTGFDDKIVHTLNDKFADDLNERSLSPKNLQNYVSIRLPGSLENGVLISDSQYYYSDSVCFYPLDFYNKTTGKAEMLRPGEALVYIPEQGHHTVGDKLEFICGDQKAELSVKAIVEPVDIGSNFAASIYVITRNDEAAIKEVLQFKDDGNYPFADVNYRYMFDTNISDSATSAVIDSFRSALIKLHEEESSIIRGYSIRSAVLDRASIYAQYGGLFFLGLILSFAFCIAAVLIMHYKQISEGYEDQSRFDIMQKVGMSKRDIRKSVNFQVRTVFYLPLLTAGCHMFFAFHMLWLILQAFGLNNTPLFICTFLCSFALFAIFYTVTYKITANSYYSIVSRQKE